MGNTFSIQFILGGGILPAFFFVIFNILLSMCFAKYCHCVSIKKLLSTKTYKNFGVKIKDNFLKIHIYFHKNMFDFTRIFKTLNENGRQLGVFSVFLYF